MGDTPSLGWHHFGDASTRQHVPPPLGAQTQAVVQDQGRAREREQVQLFARPDVLRRLDVHRQDEPDERRSGDPNPVGRTSRETAL
jgi:hypothetical protein